MEIIGRVIKDVTVTTLKDGRTVVNFSIAMNDYYKPKDSTETKHVTTYVQCSYWVSSKVAGLVTKGTLIELSGRIGVQAYKVQEDVKATLTFHVNSLKLHGKGGVKTTSSIVVEQQPIVAKDTFEPIDDLPF